MRKQVINTVYPLESKLLLLSSVKIILILNTASFPSRDTNQKGQEDNQIRMP